MTPPLDRLLSQSGVASRRRDEVTQFLTAHLAGEIDQVTRAAPFPRLAYPTVGTLTVVYNFRGGATGKPGNDIPALEDIHSSVLLSNMWSKLIPYLELIGKASHPP